MFQYHCLNPIAGVGLANFNENYQQTESLEGADAVLVRSAAMHGMELPKSLLAVARAGAGVNNIPLADCAEQGIVVFNTPGANANGVKELVLAGMLLASRDIAGGIEWVKSDKEDGDIAKTAEKQKKKFAGCEISGKKLGIIGLGAIGQLVANAATHLGMEVYGYDPYVSVDAAWGLSKDVKHITNVEDIYRDCDYITVHVPALDSTKGMINADAFALMKDGVKILNFARDVLVNDEDMKAALDSGKVAKYMTDFPNPAIAGYKNVVAFPHLGASTAESEDNCAVMACKEIKAYINDGNIKNSVNYPNVNMGQCSDVARVTICHKNIPNMLTQFTGVFSKKGGNVSGMISKAKGDYAYSILDIGVEPTADDIAELSAIEGVVKVRVIK